MPKKKTIKNNNTKIKNTNPEKTTRILGTKDILTNDFLNWECISQDTVKFLKRYGFSQIETPVLEKAELYKNLSSQDAELLYEVIGEKGEKIVLRSELRLGLIRAYLEHNLEETLPQPARIFSVGPVFRKEKVQSGRYKQFSQISMEVIGEKKAMAEVLLIDTMFNLFKDWGLNVEVQINSVGKKDCQKEYKNNLTSFFKEKDNKSNLCDNCKKLVTKDPLEVLKCKEKTCINTCLNSPQIIDFLDDESREHFSKVVEYLDELGVRYNFNSHLIKDFSYYNDTIFEFWPILDNEQIQSRFSLAGGGRHDFLAEKISGNEIPATGLVLGMERILTKLKEKGLILFEKQDNLVFVAQLSEQAKLKSMQIFEELRREGFNVKHSFATNSLKKQIEEAKLLQSRISLILGKKEFTDETILLRDMDSGIQETIKQSKLIKELEKRLK
ncbi:histidine--tRNA ligase [bacterium]|nr:histidine--tRNA ligase [bacterium]